MFNETGLRLRWAGGCRGVGSAAWAARRWRGQRSIRCTCCYSAVTGADGEESPQETKPQEATTATDEYLDSKWKTHIDELSILDQIKSVR